MVRDPGAIGGKHMASVETDVRASAEVRKFSLTTLTAMVVGSMVGAGVFSLPRNFALATGVFGALVAWVIAGTGMLMLAFVSRRWPCASPSSTPECTRTRRRGSVST